jgi:hypothetical protein
MSITPAGSAAQAREIYTQLLAQPAPLYHAPSPVPSAGLDPTLQPRIASLLVHPALEAALHLLNHALLPAHFLVRKMQNVRVGQHLHGVLHRVEGDYDNARVWYAEASGLGERTDAKTEHAGEGCFVGFWSGVARKGGLGESGEAKGDAELAKEAALAFIARVQALKAHSKGQTQDAGAGTEERRELERVSRAELVAIVEWAASKYGWGKWNGGDGSEAYTESTEEQKEEMKRQQGGGEGFRKF